MLFQGFFTDYGMVYQAQSALPDVPAQPTSSRLSHPSASTAAQSKNLLWRAPLAAILCLSNGSAHDEKQRKRPAM